MKKFLKWFLIIVAILGLGLFGGYKYMISSTKKHSPESTVQMQKDGLELEVFYNRPYKKGREIFGNLVPYGIVWRTGANEATTFETNKDLIIDGKKLAAGKYSIFTIPKENSWDVIFNSKMYNWGVKGPGKSSINRKYDALIATVDVVKTTDSVEQFTISFDETPQVALVLQWDQTKIVVPINQ